MNLEQQHGVHGNVGDHESKAPDLEASVRPGASCCRRLGKLTGDQGS